MARKESLHFQLVTVSPLGYRCRIPNDGSKYNSSGASTARSITAAATKVAPKRSDGDPGGKPENHSNSLNGGDGILVREARETRGSEDKVCDGQERPDGSEQHEINTVGRPSPPEQVDDCKKKPPVSMRSGQCGASYLGTYCRLSGQER